MTSWTGGYVLDIPYTAGFYREMAPITLYLAALMKNVRPPSLTEPYRYCELACGQGVGTMLMAASNPLGEFHGYDFNPAQIRNAHSLLGEAKLKNCTIGEESFASLCEKSDDELPSFDFIALHGTYTWVDAERRREIVRFVSKRLKPGGLFYVSWNCMPGWSPMLPIQRMMREYAARNPGRSDVQMAGAQAFLRDLMQKGSRFFASNPQLEARLKRNEGMSSNYLVHEYMHEAWQPLYATDVMRDLAEAKLTFVGTAAYGEMYDALALPADIMPLYNATADVGMRELIRDYAVNQQFRRDVYVRGATPLTPFEQRRMLGELGVVLTKPRMEVQLKAELLIGTADLSPATYDPVLDALASGSKTIDQLAASPALAGQSFGNILQAAIILSATGQAMLLPPDRKPERAKVAQEASRSLNRAIAMRTQYGDDFQFLSAAATGAAIPTNTVERLIYPELLQKQTPSREHLVSFATNNLSQTGRRLVREGTNLAPGEETQAEAQRIVDALLTKGLPIWRELGVI